MSKRYDFLHISIFIIDHYCPVGTVEPKLCYIGSICSKSKQNFYLPLLLICLFDFLVILFLLLKKHYGNLVKFEILGSSDEFDITSSLPTLNKRVSLDQNSIA